MATIKDIAKLANVSIGTVDRVIHKRGLVSYATREKVEQAIAELKYTPNIYARQLKLARKYRFGVLMPELHQDAKYWDRPATGVREAANELEARKIEVKFFHFDRFSESSFQDTFYEALRGNPDGLLIAPILSNPAKALIGEIPERIPYIFFDSDLPNTKRLTFIGQDPYKSGMLAGKLMNMLVPGGGDIAVIRVLPEDYHINQRTEGFRDYFHKNGLNNAIRIYEWQENEPSTGIDAIVMKISENANLQGIFVTNALTYLVAASTMKLDRSRQRIKIIGYDLVEENVALLKDSVIDFLITQSSITQGYLGIQLLYRKLVLNQDVDSKIMMRIDVVMKENIEFYRHAYGDKVYQNYFLF